MKEREMQKESQKKLNEDFTEINSLFQNLETKFKEFKSIDISD